VGAGIIDEGYRVEIIVFLFNFGNKEFESINYFIKFKLKIIIIFKYFL